jgi:hypothetical protein
MTRPRHLLLAATLALAAGCIVTSVHPYYDTADLVYDPALAGDWFKRVENGPDELWKFTGDPASRSYRLVLVEEREARVLEARLFKLGPQLFLDVASTEQDYHVIPPHYLLRVARLGPTVRLSELRHDWLEALLAERPDAARHVAVRTGDGPDDRRLVLTGSTAELQELVRAHLEDAAAWSEGFELAREARPATP